MSFIAKFFQEVKKSYQTKSTLQMTGHHPGITQLFCYHILEQTLSNQIKNLVLCESDSQAKKIFLLYSHQKQNNLVDIDIHLLLSTNYWDISSEKENKKTRFQRLSALNFLHTPKTTGIVVATVSGLLQRTLNTPAFIQNNFLLKKKDDLSSEALTSKLSFFGYKLISQTTSMGSYSKRGNIIDFFPPDSSTPIRIELFDDKISSISAFCQETQRTTKSLNASHIIPCWGDEPNRLRSKEIQQKFYNLLVNKGLDAKHKESLLKSLNSNEMNFDFEKVAASVNPFLTNNLEHIQQTNITLLNSSKDMQESHTKTLADFENLYEAIENYPYLSSKPQDHFEPITSFEKWLESKTSIEFCSFNTRTEVNTFLLKPELSDSFEISSLKKEIQERKNSLKKMCALKDKGYTFVLFFKEKIDLDVFSEILNNLELPFIKDPSLAINISSLFFDKKRPQFILTLGLISEIIIDEASEIIICPGNNLLPQKKAKNKISPSDIYANHDLEVKDYVTHEKHGLGQYFGLKKLNLASTFYDFLQISYKNNDSLYVPIEQINLVKRYKKYHSDLNITLDKLGGKSWQNKKNKIKENVERLAKSLLALEAKRKSREGPKMGPKSSLYYDFCDDFPFEETNDQKKAIEEIESDLCASYPMDRLIIGDVGFGKTEIAMRAAMYSVVEGYQVLLFAPTTVLSEQHYFRFLQRFSKYGISVSCLNRFHKKKSKDIIQEFSEHKIDILIGTHALFSPKIQASKLGLVILDEEHKMGVAQKKKLKDIAQTANFLTMTATPIPRTLNMSMLGLRDTSLIREAPFGRLPIKTIFSEKNAKMINNAISFELEREGQVIYLHNTIENHSKIKKELSTAFPKILITIAHGQMSPLEIEKNMTSFSKGEAKILLTTTIVESGIDIPNVNTLIVSDCEKYGLAQLHQLRGRVGRSSAQAYAYFFCHKEENLTDLAKKRMSAIVTYDGLGAGFSLANTDMSIRGVGNLLGVEQSGDMESIGIDHYLEMLEEAVTELQTGVTQKENIQPEIRINDKAGIPDFYMKSETERVNFYRSLFKASNQESIKEIFSLTRDMYGPFPEELKNLYTISLIKLLLIKIKAKKLRQVSDKSYEITLLLPEGDESKTLETLDKTCQSVSLIDKTQAKASIQLETKDLSELLLLLLKIEKTTTKN